MSFLKASTKRAALGVALLVFSLITVLSFIHQAGRVGEPLVMLLRRTFGWLGYGVPIILARISYSLLRPPATERNWSRTLGAILAVVGLLGVFHLAGVAPDDALQVASEGKGGGFLGFMLTYPLQIFLSPLATLLIFLAAFLIGCFMAFDISPSDVWGWLTAFVPTRAAAPEGGTEGEEMEEFSSGLPRFRINRVSTRGSAPDPAQLKLQEQQLAQEQEQKALARKQLKAANKRYNLPPLELLSSVTREPDGGDVQAKSQKIQETLNSFGITVAMDKEKVGPTVTQYRLRPQEGVRLSQITALQNDLALALEAHPVRIEAPIPNTNMVGIEIPNKEVALVRLRDLLASKEFRRSESPLTFSLGKDVSGRPVVDTLERMPHLLIAGATNSGKSVCIHSLLMSLLFRNSPSLVQLILVDPKRVELTAYNDIPHLPAPVIVDSHRALNALKWALREMDVRYKLLEESKSRNLMSYNLNNPQETKPFIIIIIDELADLMAKHAREVEGPIVRLSQMARAVGIHLVLATQRPSVNVITGLIKANIPSRIAFKVASQIDSRTILDMAGAEKLVGTGDMLYLAGNQSKPVRLQGGFVSEDEVHAVVGYIKEHNADIKTPYDDSITSRGGSSDSVGGEAGDDALFEEAKRIVMQAGKASSSLLMRRLRVGYARSARLVDMLEEQGVVAPAEGNKPREVILRDEEDANFTAPPASTDDDMPPVDAIPPAAPETEDRQW